MHFQCKLICKLSIQNRLLNSNRKLICKLISWGIMGRFLLLRRRVVAGLRCPSSPPTLKNGCRRGEHQSAKLHAPHRTVREDVVMGSTLMTRQHRDTVIQTLECVTCYR